MFKVLIISIFCAIARTKGVACIPQPETVYVAAANDYEADYDDYAPEYTEPATEAEVITEQDTAGDAGSEGWYAGYYNLTAYEYTGSPCADGQWPAVGYTAACNDPALWYHWIYIEGYGTLFVHDTGGMSSNVIDIYLGDYETCINFGTGGANVYVID